MSGDEFADWYAREGDRVARALTLITGDTDLAQDAVAEAFTRAYERWERVRVMRSRTGWVYRVALNHARRRARRRALEVRLLKRSPVPAIPPIEARPDVWEAVASLPARQREAIVLRYVADLREREVAEAMGISEGAASASLSSARTSLAAALTPSSDEEASHR